MLEQDVARARELLAARLRGRVVERERQVGGGGGGEARLDHRPRLALVGERDHAEVVAERRARARRGGLHRRDAGDDAHGQAREARAAVLDRLVDRRRHGEDAGVARRDDGHARAAERELERLARALELDAVVARAPLLAAPRRHAREVRARSRRARRRAPARCAPRASASPGPAGPSPTTSRRAGCPAAASSSAPGTSTSDM